MPAKFLNPSTGKDFAFYDYKKDIYVSLAELLQAKASVSIGRAEDCDFQIVNLNVSRHHALLTRQKRGEKEIYFITDLSSKNGTYINGKRITSDEKYLLQNNDLIEIADRKDGLVFKFVEE